MRSVIGFASLAVSDAVTKVQMAVGKTGGLSLANADDDTLPSCTPNNLVAQGSKCKCGDADAGNADKGEYCWERDPYCTGDECKAVVKQKQAVCNNNEMSGEAENSAPCQCNAGNSDVRNAQVNCGIGVNTNNKRCYATENAELFNGVRQQSCHEWGKCRTHNTLTLSKVYASQESFAFCKCNGQMCGKEEYCLSRDNHFDGEAFCSPYMYCPESDSKPVGVKCATGFLTIKDEELDLEISDPTVEFCTETQFYYSENGVTKCRDYKKGSCGKCQYGTPLASDSEQCTGAITADTSTCVQCNNDYVLSGNAGNGATCVEKKCTKDTGCATESTRGNCKVHNTKGCDKAETGYSVIQSPSALVNSYVVANVCHCSNGVPATGAACKNMNAHICATCQDGFEVKNDRCVRKAVGAKAGEPGATAQGGSCDKHTMCSSGVCGVAGASKKEGATCTNSNECFSKSCVGKANEKKCSGNGKCYGKAKFAESEYCSLSNSEGCATCNDNFKLSGKKCQYEECKCTNGNPLGGDLRILCGGASKQSCQSCHANFAFSEGGGGKSCTANQCTCKDGATTVGTVASGNDCPLDGANTCASCTNAAYGLVKHQPARFNEKTSNIFFHQNQCVFTCALLGGGCKPGGTNDIGDTSGAVAGKQPNQWDESNGQCCAKGTNLDAWHPEDPQTLTCSPATFTKQGQGLVKVGFLSKDADGNEKYVLNSQVGSSLVNSCQSVTQKLRNNYILNQARLGAGAACTTAEQRSCRSNKCTADKCVAAKPQTEGKGGDCSKDAECNPGTYCLTGKCTTSIAPGTKCVTGGSDRQCANGKACPTGADPVCGKMADGDACTGTVGQQGDCATGLKCFEKVLASGTKKMCTNKKMNNEAGTTDADCASGYSDAGTCKPQVANDGACKTAAATGSAQCASGKCAAKSATGDAEGTVCTTAKAASCKSESCPAAAGAAADATCANNRACMSNKCMELDAGGTQTTALVDLASCPTGKTCKCKTGDSNQVQTCAAGTVNTCQA